MSREYFLTQLEHVLVTNFGHTTMLREEYAGRVKVYAFSTRRVRQQRRKLPLELLEFIRDEGAEFLEGTLCFLHSVQYLLIGAGAHLDR